MKTKITCIILTMLLITMPMPQLLAMTMNTTPMTNQTSKPRTFLEKAWDVLSSPPKQYYQIDQQKTEFGKFMDSLRFAVDDTKIEHNQYIDIRYKTYGINPLLYRELLSTEKQTKQNSIIKGKNGTGFQIITQHDDTGDHVFISIDNETINKLVTDDQTTKNLIQNKWNQHFEEPFSKFRPKMLAIIQEIAPELHAKITEFDKNGSQHIIMGNSLGSVNSLTSDGLPEIKLGYDFMKLSPNIQRAIIAHEIGHYALEHQVTRLSNLNLGDNTFNKTASDTKANVNTTLKASNKKLEPTKALNNAYVRTYEYEADRFAMVNMVVSYDDVEAMVKSLSNTDWCTTFKVDHPLNQDRLKQFQAITSELELLKNSPSRKKAPIDWDKLQYNSIQAYSFMYDQNNDLSTREQNFKDRVEKYLPDKLTDAEKYIQGAKNYIKEKATQKDLQPLSTKEWVNIHKFLRPIDSPMIEKLQLCEAAGASCIKRGEDGTGIQIIQDPENADKFMISFDTQTIDQINSRDPQVRTELNKNIQDIFTKHLADNAKSKTAKNNAKRKTNRSLPTRKPTQELTITQPQIESKLTIDKPMFTSPFAIKTKIASPYNNIGNRIKNTPPTAQTQQIQNAIKINQQNQRARQLTQQHQSEHLVEIY